MKLPYFLFLSAGLLVFVACQNNPEPAAAPAAENGAVADVEAIAKSLLGTWETVEVDVLFHSYENRDTSFRQTIREADWGQVFGVKPARTEFTADGKHKRTHRMENGSVADITNGVWKVKSTDSLLVIEPNKTLYYAHEMKGDQLILTGFVDYDYDGEADDEYRSVMRLVSRTQ
ncbi:hypothetical protein [Lewinella sp. 4G2]|uniref:hypothetical protein n=1 Tax=Lewinella sp. 4G2 TaxID=1803372 RepID=UPI0007B4862D|nr:hypothetical protein [Lewinella sp. 4G2]OAV44597.1 hypothetical protein A3850_008875 [Lewinella sp. 4G2]